MMLLSVTGEKAYYSGIAQELLTLQTSHHALLKILSAANFPESNTGNEIFIPESGHTESDSRK